MADGSFHYDIVTKRTCQGAGCDRLVRGGGLTRFGQGAGWIWRHGALGVGATALPAGFGGIWEVLTEAVARCRCRHRHCLGDLERACPAPWRGCAGALVWAESGASLPSRARATRREIASTKPRISSSTQTITHSGNHQPARAAMDWTSASIAAPKRSAGGKSGTFDMAIG